MASMEADGEAYWAGKLTKSYKFKLQENVLAKSRKHTKAATSPVMT